MLQVPESSRVVKKGRRRTSFQGSGARCVSHNCTRTSNCPGLRPSKSTVEETRWPTNTLLSPGRFPPPPPIVLPVPGPGFRDRLRAGVGRKPNHPGLRAGQFGTGFWSVRANLPAQTGNKSAPESRSGAPDVAAVWQLFKIYMFNSGPDPPDPPNSAGNDRSWRPRTPPEQPNGRTAN